jgi:dTDP-4-amino-4,6-dideoxygalactose transaminase
MCISALGYVAFPKFFFKRYNYARLNKLFMPRPIFIATHPNFESDDRKIVNRLLFFRRQWSNYSNVKKFEELVGGYFDRPAFAVDSARSALFVYLRALELPEQSEVMLPAFSCMVVANAVKWAGL